MVLQVRMVIYHLSIGGLLSTPYNFCLVFTTSFPKMFSNSIGQAFEQRVELPALQILR